MNAGEPIRRPSRVGPRPSHQPSASTSSAPQQQVHDGFYGHEETAKICASYVASTFSCPENPPPPVVCDDTYSNKSWCVVGQGMFSLKEINQMEREMCSYLEWKLNFEPTELAQFEARVRRDYGSTSTTRSTQSISRPAVAPIDTTTRNKSSYPSPPDSPSTPATAASPPSSRSHAMMTPPSEVASSRSSMSSVSSMFSTQTASTHATSVSASSSYIPKTGEPGYAYVSRSVW